MTSTLLVTISISVIQELVTQLGCVITEKSDLAENVIRKLD